MSGCGQTFLFIQSHAADAGFAGVGRYGPELKEKPIEFIMAPRSGAGRQWAMEAAGIEARKLPYGFGKKRSATSCNSVSAAKTRGRISVLTQIGSAELVTAHLTKYAMRARPSWVLSSRPRQLPRR
jgi:hypothetical protein